MSTTIDNWVYEKLQNSSFFPPINLKFIFNNKKSYFYFCPMGRFMVPSVRDNIPLGTQQKVSLDFEKEWAHEGRQI